MEVSHQDDGQWVPGESSDSHLQENTFLIHPHMASPLEIRGAGGWLAKGRCGENDRDNWYPFLFLGTSPIRLRPHTQDLTLPLFPLYKHWFPNTVTMEVRALIFGRGYISVHDIPPSGLPKFMSFFHTKYIHLIPIVNFKV